MWSVSALKALRNRTDFEDATGRNLTANGETTRKSAKFLVFFNTTGEDEEVFRKPFTLYIVFSFSLEFWVVTQKKKILKLAWWSYLDVTNSPKVVYKCQEVSKEICQVAQPNLFAWHHIPVQAGKLNKS